VGAQAAAQSFAIDEEPIVRTLKTIVPLAATFLALQGVAEVVRRVMALRSAAWPPRLQEPAATTP
jgi:TRAP-type mannitol/chloroaromatic compound transport system permease small subunit